MTEGTSAKFPKADSILARNWTNPFKICNVDTTLLLLARPLTQSLPSIAACPMNIDDIQSHPTHLNPPKPQPDDTMSISSFASTPSRKARPESLLIQPSTEPVILGVALVDFNHLVCSQKFRFFCSFDAQSS